MAIMIVDDNRTNLMLLSSLAESATQIACNCFEDPVEALYASEKCAPDLVLVDYRMPNLSGNDFIRLFRQTAGCADVPIVMVTTENERDVRQEAFTMGATEFLSKPVDAIEFRLRVRNLLALSQAQALLTDRAKLLQHEVDRATLGILQRERELVVRLSKAAEFRDPETGAHINRMAHYSKLIACKLELPETFQRLLLDAAPMHDVGKLATPDNILLKPGRLDDAEMAIMRRHAEIGAQILSGSDSPLLQLAEEIAATHHEKFDGGGYPKGLAGEAIPLAGRIVAVADVFDALTSERPYKRAWSLDDARQFLRDHTGTHFCPLCANAFLDAWDEVLMIRSNFPD
ncbi:MAG TPA: HD domain-containing phosphohydrolase [Burkholderiaceae bacterium]|jgi:putative two-component system response regulator